MTPWMRPELREINLSAEVGMYYDQESERGWDLGRPESLGVESLGLRAGNADDDEAPAGGVSGGRALRA